MKRRQNAAGLELALLLLAACMPDMSPGSLAKLPIGQRDGLLLTLRERLFGPTLVGLVSCPKHGGNLELVFDVQDIRVGETAEPYNGRIEAPVFTHNGYKVQYRLPDSTDIAAIAGHTEVSAAKNALVRRCLVAVYHQDNPMPVETLPEGVFDEVASALATEMEKADPQANTRLAVVCPDCGHEWETTFDIGSFLWAEIDTWVRRTLREVHVLASTYGWREQDILALSPERRQLYLEVINA